MPTRAKRGRARTTARKTTTRRKATSRSAATKRARRKTSARSAGRSRPRATTRRRPAPESELQSRTLDEVMSADPVCFIETETVLNTARVMKEQDIGDVLVLGGTDARVKGIVTDRDMVVRVLAEERDPVRTTIGAICSEELVCLTPRDTVDKAVKLMRQKAIRRLPVVEDGHAVGMVSIGDLAERFDKRSALADISAAPANT